MRLLILTQFQRRRRELVINQPAGAPDVSVAPSRRCGRGVAGPENFLQLSSIVSECCHTPLVFRHHNSTLSRMHQKNQKTPKRIHLSRLTKVKSLTRAKVAGRQALTPHHPPPLWV